MLCASIQIFEVLYSCWNLYFLLIEWHWLWMERPTSLTFLVTPWGRVSPKPFPPQTPVYSPPGFTVIIINVTQKSIKFLPIHGYWRAGGRLKCEAHKSSRTCRCDRNFHPTAIISPSKCSYACLLSQSLQIHCVFFKVEPFVSEERHHQLSFIHPSSAACPFQGRGGVEPIPAVHPGLVTSLTHLILKFNSKLVFETSSKKLILFMWTWRSCQLDKNRGLRQTLRKFNIVKS